MIWNFDISAAPRGFTVTSLRNVRTKEGIEEKAYEEFIHEPVIIATIKGEVVKSRWLPPTTHTPSGRWDGFPENATSIRAWMEWPIAPKPSDSPVLGRLLISRERIAFVDDAGTSA